MNSSATFGIARLSVVGAILLLPGCQGDPRTSNQGGGNLISATTKVFDQQLNQLTPDEVQIVADLVSELTPDLDLELSDDVAGAVADLFSENNVTTFDELGALAEAIVQVPESVTVPISLTTLFVEDRTANQGGGTIMSAIGKIKGDTLSQLTADEIQIIADLVGGLMPGLHRTLSDAQADTLVAFLQEQDIQTLEAAKDLVDLAADDPDAGMLPPALEQLWADFENLKGLKDLDLSHLDLGNLF